MKIKHFVRIGHHTSVRKFRIMTHIGYVFSEAARGKLQSRLELEDIDVVKVVIVLSIETTKDDHAAANKAGRVPSPSLG